ncbi:MAG TPA: hypothetical protein PLZ06_08850 [Clostridia bacterium]|jgi:hypothetical protein|nr:hypothetical protein [Clostridia bacterium]HQC69112.1 hypothetical protein [Clostridia bacterium]
MKKYSVLKTLSIILSLVLISAVALVGCNLRRLDSDEEKVVSVGTLLLRVNPEIAIEYDNNGIVVALQAKNEDAEAILKGKEGLVGKETREVISKLVDAIGEAGYFVEEIEGEARQITIEITKGSKLPYDQFIEEVVAEVRKSVEDNNWKAPLGVKNDSDFGLADYNDKDYHSSDDDDDDTDEDDIDDDDNDTDEDDIDDDDDDTDEDDIDDDDEDDTDDDDIDDDDEDDTDDDNIDDDDDTDD